MRRVVRLVLAAAGMLLTAGCSGYAGLADAKLPGGPDVGDDPRTITVEAADVLNLARQATVKVDDVSVGVVDEIERDGWRARVTMRIRSDIELPANTVAAVRQTGLLGEKYIELSHPVAEEATGSLETGAVITIDRTSRSFEVEEVLGALSLLLNGGGIDRIHTITTELNNALEGREGEFRALLTELTDFNATLNRHRDAVVDAIDGLDRLSASAAEGRKTIKRALADIPDALRVLSEQREELVRMLTATSQLSDVATTTIDRTRRALLEDLRLLEPVLTQLAASGESIPRALEYLLTFPFSTDSLQALKGDYFNFDMEISLNQQDFEHLLSGSDDGSTSPPPEDDPGSDDPTAPIDDPGEILDLLIGSVL